MTTAERRDANRLRSERWRRAHGIMPRKPASKPWLAEGVSRSTWYRRGNRVQTLVGAPPLKCRGAPTLSRAEAFVRQLQAELAEVTKRHAIAAAVIAELIIVLN